MGCWCVESISISALDRRCDLGVLVDRSTVAYWGEHSLKTLARGFDPSRSVLDATYCRISVVHTTYYSTIYALHYSVGKHYSGPNVTAMDTQTKQN